MTTETRKQASPSYKETSDYLQTIELKEKFILAQKGFLDHEERGLQKAYENVCDE